MNQPFLSQQKTSPFIKPERSEKVWDNITKETFAKKNNIFNVSKKIAVVAILLVVFIGCPLYFYFNHNEVATTFMVTNKEKKDTAFYLPDGSLVHLYPESKIAFQELDTRNISLEGTAVFEVKKNPAKPFMVTTKNLITTALGTIFLVAENAAMQTTQIKLLEGKIKIAYDTKDNIAEEKILLAGEGFYFNHLYKNFTLSANNVLKMKNRDSEKSKRFFDEAINLNYFYFSQKPLNEVLHILGQEYQQKIIFNNKALMHHSFTGNFDKNDSLSHILNLICKINRFHLKQSEASFIVE